MGGGGSGTTTTEFSAPSSASPGQSVTVTLSGSSFKGFIVKASQGTFTGHSAATETQAKTGCTGYSSAASHINSAAKSSISFTLTMPASGLVTIEGQVVTGSSSSHTVASTTITVSSSSTPPPPPVVDCAGTWSSWGACSATCGGGTQSRSYTVSTPASGGGTSCPASHGEMQSQQCNTGACPVDCVGSWSSWGHVLLHAEEA